MNISLSGEMKKFIASELKAGRYGKPSDVVRATMQSLMQQSVPAFAPGELDALLADGEEALRNMALLTAKHPFARAVAGERHKGYCKALQENFENEIPDLQAGK